jgi:hypothetical protein
MMRNQFLRFMALGLLFSTPALADSVYAFFADNPIKILMVGNESNPNHGTSADLFSNFTKARLNSSQLSNGIVVFNDIPSLEVGKYPGLDGFHFASFTIDQKNSNLVAVVFRAEENKLVFEVSGEMSVGLFEVLKKSEAQSSVNEDGGTVLKTQYISCQKTKEQTSCRFDVNTNLQKSSSLKNFLTEENIAPYRRWFVKPK